LHADIKRNILNPLLRVFAKAIFHQQTGLPIKISVFSLKATIV